MVRTDFYDPLMRDLRNGDLDLLIGLSMTEPHDARHVTNEEVVWVRGPGTRIDPTGRCRWCPTATPASIAAWCSTRSRAAGFEWEDVFIGPSIASLEGARQRRPRHLAHRADACRTHRT